MVKRLFDVVCATIALTVSAPILLVVAIGIKLSDHGPVLYRATRAGRYGVPYTMLKFRTMTQSQTPTASAVTAHRDARVFPFGRLLRKTKLDELPQLINVLRGQMSLIGPRPEDPKIVARYYGRIASETLATPPGLASPGSIYNYTHGERLLVGGETEAVYAEELLPTKLALDVVYARNATFAYDVRVLVRTVVTIARISKGQTVFEMPPEWHEAQPICDQIRGQYPL